MFANGTPVALVTRVKGEPDADGNDTWTETFTTTTSGFAPETTSENDQGQIQVTDQPILYLDHLVILTAVDQVVISPTIVDGVITTPQSDRYEIDGKPKPWTSPFDGWEAGTAIPLKQVNG